jgi:sugar lactone lactonase YvrE
MLDDPEGPPLGSVHRIVDGAPELVVGGLVMPHGIAFDGDGNLYVTINTLMSGPDMPASQVIRMDGVAAPA